MRQPNGPCAARRPKGFHVQLPLSHPFPAPRRPNHPNEGRLVSAMATMDFDTLARTTSNRMHNDMHGHVPDGSVNPAP